MAAAPARAIQRSEIADRGIGISQRGPEDLGPEPIGELVLRVVIHAAEPSRQGARLCRILVGLQRKEPMLLKRHKAFGGRVWNPGKG